MKVIALMENIPYTKAYKSTHALCYYISYLDQEILFDLGSNHLFLDNAQTKGIKIQNIDRVIVSHGHKDHGGGLKNFFSQNRTAQVFVRENAFTPLFVMINESPRFVGLDSSFETHPQVVLVEGNMSLDDNLFLFTNVDGCRFLSHSNCVLFEKDKNKYIQDMFDHEQNLILTVGDLRVLFCGCAHNGIVNILSMAEQLAGGPMTHVIGGFHLHDSFANTEESPELVQNIAFELKKRDTIYYTGHCTGKKAYQQLKEILGSQIHYFHAGEEISLT